MSAFKNGSLYPQMSKNQALNFTNAYPLHDQDPGVNLTVFNQSLQLNFERHGDNFLFASPVLMMLLNPNGTVALLNCAYPLSGQYDHLARWLFYAALIVAILFRHLPIIASTALASVMTYSTLSAIHLFVLFGEYKFQQPADWWFSLDAGTPGWDGNSATRGGDIDFFGILPVVTTTCIMLTPILTWSTTFRSNQARALIVWWAVFIFASIIPVYLEMDDFRTTWTVDTLPGIAYCDTQSEIPNGTILTWAQYDTYQCVDFCGLYSPKAPLRAGASMAPLLASQLSMDIIYKIPETQTLNDTYLNLVVAVFIFLALAIVRGAFAILQSFSSLPNTRNYVFRAIYSPRRFLIRLLFRGRRRQRYLDKLSPSPTFLRRPRLLVAKCIAALYYLLSVLGMFAYPVFFVLTAFFCEVVLGTVSNSEHSDAIGAWAPWAAAALIVVATVIMDYHRFAVEFLRGLARAPLHRLQYDANDLPDRGRERKGVGARAAAAWRDAAAHASFRWRLKLWTIRESGREFRNWWRDPEGYDHVDSERRESDLLKAPSTDKPSCGCSKCQNPRKDEESGSNDEKDGGRES